MPIHSGILEHNLSWYTSFVDFDVLIVGGGTGGISVASSIKKRRPQLSIGIVEPHAQCVWFLCCILSIIHVELSRARLSWSRSLLILYFAVYPRSLFGSLPSHFVLRLYCLDCQFEEILLSNSGSTTQSARIFSLGKRFLLFKVVEVAVAVSYEYFRVNDGRRNDPAHVGLNPQFGGYKSENPRRCDHGGIQNLQKWLSSALCCFGTAAFCGSNLPPEVHWTGRRISFAREDDCCRTRAFLSDISAPYFVVTAMSLNIYHIVAGT